MEWLTALVTLERAAVDLESRKSILEAAKEFYTASFRRSRLKECGAN
jgi:hypothetical protein